MNFLDLIISIFPQAPAEVEQPFRSNSPRADTLRRSECEVFPFQFCPTPSEPRKSPSGEKTACPFLSLPTKNLNILMPFYYFFNTILDQIISSIGSK